MNGKRSKALRKVASLTTFKDEEGNLKPDYDTLSKSEYLRRNTSENFVDPLTGLEVFIMKCTAMLVDSKKLRNKQIKKQYLNRKEEIKI